MTRYERFTVDRMGEEKFENWKAGYTAEQYQELEDTFEQGRLSLLEDLKNVFGIHIECSRSEEQRIVNRIEEVSKR